MSENADTQSIERPTNVDELVDQVRSDFLREWNTNSELCCESDLMDIKSNDLLIARYLEKKKYNVNDTVDMMKEAFTWRKCQGLSDLKARDFPREMFESGSVFLYKEDKEDNLTLYIRALYYRRIDDVRDLLEKFVIYHLNQLYELSRAKGNDCGCCLIFDFNGTGLGNVDQTMTSWLTNILAKYYPAGMKRVVICNLPWYLQQLSSLAISLIPEERRHLLTWCSSNDLKKYIDADNIPLFLGGRADDPFFGTLDECPTVIELLKQNYNFDDEKMEQMVKFFDDMIPKS